MQGTPRASLPSHPTLRWCQKGRCFPMGGVRAAWRGLPALAEDSQEPKPPTATTPMFAGRPGQRSRRTQHRTLPRLGPSARHLLPAERSRAPAPATGTLGLQRPPEAPLRRGSQSDFRDHPRRSKGPALTRSTKEASGNPQMPREELGLPGLRRCWWPQAPAAQAHPSGRPLLLCFAGNPVFGQCFPNCVPWNTAGGRGEFHEW